ncbi:uncharacterized protein LOC101773571 [Setaria italica]|uniref:uncharacterized protein LOC101773571 n=1 Tax=Setaria italica TaxID=4555 RepID=UPI000645D992|nr:uncharacterized protein LOC101773571 [Setaria italica]
MVRSLKKAPGGFTHLLLVVDKFTKWIKPKRFTNIRLQEAVEFFLNIVYRFGVPNCIIIDNGTNFTGKKFLDFCDGYSIRVDWASVGHPQTNGQVERANGMVPQGLKPHIFDRLKKHAGCWVAELLAVLWSLRTTQNRSTSFTSFFLVYVAEAVLPSNLDYDSPRVKAFDQDQAAEAQQDAINLLEEVREMALIRSAWTQTTKDKHKLSPPWEGPYTVAEVIHPSAYQLKDDDANILTNTWNIEQLRHFFP